MKGKLIIKNVGPIKDVTIDLNKINVIIGKQGSGKSTIAKLISYMLWTEKRIMSRYILGTRTHTVIEDFYERLISFHKLQGYFSVGSRIEYESEIYKIRYERVADNNDMNDNRLYVTGRNVYNYQRNKVAYIPAERNLVAAIPNWFQVQLPDNNIRSFMSDWVVARRMHTKETPLLLFKDKIEYYFDENANEDIVRINNNKVLRMSNTASGYQSSIPLFAVAEYVARLIYSNEKDSSIEELDSTHITRKKIIAVYLKKRFPSETMDSINAKIANSSIDGNKENIYSIEYAKSQELANKFTSTQRTQLIIEEPEQNLFPQTQRDAIYRLLNLASDERVSLTLTTHSPYVLYAINNCIMGGLVKDIIPKEVSEKLLSKPNWIDPTSVSIWQITDDGGIISVQNEKTNTLKSQYLNTSMNEVMNEYFTMLKYLK